MENKNSFLDILKENQTKDIHSFYLSLFSNIKESECNYDFVEKIDKVIEYLSADEEQLSLVKEKLDIDNREKLFDAIAEICVFYDFIKEEPLFIKECKKETPDIQIKGRRFIEIKRVRFSDNQINLLNNILQKTEEDKIFLSSNNTSLDYNDVSALKNKLEQKIDKALSQMNDKTGFVYIIYSLDINGQVKPVFARKEEFIDYCNDYFAKKNNRNIVLKVVFLNDLLENVHYSI